jgi:hypothetical protein
MSVFWRIADLSNITRVKELKLVPLMPGPSPEPDVLDCDNSCESQEDPNILCNVSLMVTPSTPLPALTWNRRYTDWNNKPSERGNPVNECNRDVSTVEGERAEVRRTRLIHAACCQDAVCFAYGFPQPEQ